MGVGMQVGLEATSTLARAGLGIHAGIERAFAEASARRERAVDSVTELALRLREARGAQRAAEMRAAQAEAQLAAARAEMRQLREALRAEQRLSGALREVCGV